MLFIATSLQLAAQNDSIVRHDNVTIAPRSFDSEKLDDFKQQQWFDYEEPAPEASGFWDWLIRKVIQLLSKMFSNEGSTPYYRNTIIILVVLSIFYVLFRKFSSGLFKQSGENDMNFEEVSDDIYANDLDKLLEKAIREQAYRHAVRILFLKHIKQLTEKKHIAWEIQKTNHDYWYEIKNEGHLSDFKELCSIYEHVWYGDFSINTTQFQTTSDLFKNKITKL